VAPEFLSWLKRPADLRWLDVGCGTGALCAAILEQCAPAMVAGVEPSDGFRRSAESNLGGRATLYPGSATAIPLDDRSVEVVVSGLVLNFVSDLPAALAEMKRVTRRAGTIAAYVWDYAGRMEFLRAFWDAAVALDAAAVTADEGRRFPLCRPEPLEHAFDAAGLEGVEVRSIDVPTPFADFEDYWQPFLEGQGPAPTYAMSLGEAQRGRLRDTVRARLPIAPDGSISLVARAWAIRGTCDAHPA
jgi:SAM-dependent methyltransferase